MILKNLALNIFVVQFVLFVFVNSGNAQTAPDVTDIADQTVNEGEAFTTIILDNYVTDDNTGDENIEWTYSGNTSLIVDITNRLVTVTYPEGWTGSETITFTATDTDGLSASDAATFTVTAVNEAPVITGQANVLTTAEETALTIELSDVTFTDVDNTVPDDHILIVQDGSDYSHVGNEITPNADITGDIIVSVVVSDQQSINATSDAYGLTVTVTSVNDSPVITGQANVLTTSEETALTIELSDVTFTDVDNIVLDDHILIVLDGSDYSHVGNEITPNADITGDIIVDVVVSDQQSINATSDAYGLTVTVTSVNDSPVITGQANVLITSEETALTIELSDVTFTDVDNTVPDDHILIVQDGSDYSHVGNEITPNADITGDIIVDVVVSDQQSINATSDAYGLTVTVTSVNDAPTGDDSSIAIAEDETHLFVIGDFTNYSDPEGNALTAIQIATDVSQGALTSGGSAISTGNTYSLGNISYTPESNTSGTNYTSFTYYLVDSEGGVSALANTMTINVTAVNDVPTGDDSSITISEDETHLFVIGDFTNYSDPEGNALTAIQIATDVSQGALTSGGSAISTGNTYSLGNISYTPESNTSGTNYTSFTYYLVDSEGGVSALANTMTINVTAVNDAPTGDDSSITISEDETHLFVIGDFTNYSDPEGNALTAIQIATDVSQGALTSGGSAISTGNTYSLGNISYTPESNTSGTNYTSFTYYLVDSEGGVSALANTMSINVTSVNDVPTGDDSSITIAEDETHLFVIGDFTNYSDSEGNALTAIQIATDVSQGALTSGGSAISTGVNYTLGSLSYTPALNASGDNYTTFTYYLVDSEGGVSALANTMTINVTAVNDVPTGDDSSITIAEDETHLFVIGDFTNYSDPEGNALTYIQIATDVSLGELSSGGSAISTGVNYTLGSLSYTPALNASGDNYTTFTYYLVDSEGGVSASANTMTINVTAVNDAPVLTVGNVSISENYAGIVLTATSTDADSEDHHVYSITGTDSGGFDIDSNNGVLTFKTSPDYENPIDANTDNVYEITIIVTDDAGSTDSEDVTVTILDVEENSNYSILAIGNTTVYENSTYTSGPLTISGSPIGSLTYSLGGVDESLFSINTSTGEVSMDARDYENPEDDNVDNVYEVNITAKDQDDNTSSVLLNVTVLPINEYDPVISVSSTLVEENHTGVIEVASSTDSDADDSATYSLSGTDSGQFDINEFSGELVFIASPDYENPVDDGGNNIYDITITVTDDAGNFDDQSITITVANLNDNNPVGADDYIVVSEGGTVSVLNDGVTSVLDNDSDADGNSLTANLLSPTNYGSLTFNSNGTFSYSHDGSETTSDSFTYEADDGINNSNAVTVHITVTGVNDLPVIGDIPDQTIEESGSFNSISLNNYISDAETLDEDIEWSLDPTPTNFAVEINNGSATITPADEEWNGVEVLTFVATDEGGAFVSDNVRLEVTAVNDVPAITGQNTISIAEDTPTELSLNDLIVYDPDDNYPTGFTLTVLSGSNYQVTGNAITPNENITGLIVVPVYVTDDEAAQSNTYDLQVTVVNDNDPPVLIDIPNQTIPEGSMFNTIQLNNYVSDPDNTDDQISWTYSGNTELTIDIDRNSHVATIEIPDEDWFGQEAVVFTASDGLLTATNSVVLTVTAVNDAPVINSQQSLIYNEDAVFTIPYTALNVTDVDNTYPGEHEMTLLSGNNYTFIGRQVTPGEDFNGVLSIPVYITDLGSENQTSNTFNLRVTINAVNDAPQIESQINTLSTNEDIPIVISLDDVSIMDPDNSSGDFSLTIQPGDNYSFSGTTVTPALNYYGTLSVGVTVDDGEDENSESRVFTVSVLVLAQNDTPVANSQSVTTPENQEISINIHNLISDVEDALDLPSLKITSDVSNGTTTVDVDNTTIIYNPYDGYSGSDSFTYEICDQDGACAAGIITITVSNEAPAGVDDVAEVDEDNSISIDVLSNDTDPQGNIDPNTLTLLSVSQNGALSVQSEGLIVYTPNQNFFGEDEFDYQVCDEDDYCTSAHVSITVNSVNDKPVVMSQNTVQISEDTSYTITLNDLTVSDVDNNYPSEFALDVLSGGNYSVVGNTVTPELDFNGELTVNVVVDDLETENNVSDIYPFVITVSPVNDQPVIVNQADLSTNEDEPLTVTLNDFTVDDPDNNYPNDFILVVMAGLNYTVTNNVITPSDDYYGYINVPVYVSDQSDENDRSRIFNLVVQVISQNDAPLTQNVYYSTSENVSLEINMADLVTDVDGNIDYSSFVNTTNPSDGIISYDDNDVITYVPDDGFSGDDRFSFTFSDSEGLISNLSTVFISVSNEAPNAVDDYMELNEDEDVVVLVLDNDIDPQDNIDPTTLVIVNNPVNGELSINSNTSEITYTPDLNFSGSDDFRYRIFDHTGYSDDATVTLTILPVNDLPVVVSDDVETNEDQDVVVDVLINDYDIDSEPEGFTVSVSENPQNGSAAVNSDNTIVYTPNENYNGEDIFMYQLCDQQGGCSIAPVNIVIAPQNDAPVALDDEIVVAQEVASVIDVAANDSDIDNNLDLTSVEIVTDPQGGVCSVVSLTGEITYTSNVGFSGADFFVYRICDTEGLCSTATVNISVSLQNMAPECLDDLVLMTDGATVTFNVLDNDTDANADDITVILVNTDDLGGFLEQTDNGVFTYTSVYGNYCIEEYFTYQGCDDSGNCDDAIVQFTISVADTDGDNIADYNEEQHYNTDGDEYPDYLDVDSDNDGILDVVEGGVSNLCAQDIVDTDEDGIFNYRDEDSDSDGIPDIDEGSGDCDNDGIADYIDYFDDCAERIDAPDTFSPNGDGVNDYFIIPGISAYDDNEIFIYNRWGGEVFHMMNYDNQWDGKSSKSAIGSAELPQGLYFYVVKLGSNQGVLKGSVYIKR